MWHVYDRIELWNSSIWSPDESLGEKWFRIDLYDVLPARVLSWWSTADNSKLFLPASPLWMKVQGWQLVTRLYKIIAALKTYSRAAEILNNKWYNDGVSCVSRPWVQSRDARGERRPASAQFKYSHSFSPEQHTTADTESTHNSQ